MRKFGGQRRAMPDLANGQWHRSAMAPAGSSPVVGAASHSIDALSFSAFARGGLSMDSENKRGVTLALVSSIFIGTSFIIKKKGLMMAGQTGLRASAGGYSYLLQPLWWVGMATMIGGEFANLAAYAYAPAIVVTPLGASTIIISAILANCFLGETMHLCGVFACMLTVVGSAILVRCAEAPSTRHLLSSPLCLPLTARWPAALRAATRPRRRRSLRWRRSGGSRRSRSSFVTARASSRLHSSSSIAVLRATGARTCWCMCSSAR